jgi:hypothetical protein
VDQDTLLAIVAISVTVLVLGLLAVGAFLVIRDTVRGRGNWGIPGRMPTACPECEEPLPMVRVPTSFRQALWGGWTCTYCGCEIDKWGKVIAPPTRPVEWDDEEDDDRDEAPRPRRRPPDERFRGKNDG